MPELPEVERARRTLESAAVGRRVERAWCADDRIVYDGVTPTAVRRLLTGATVAAARRRGKQAWIELEGGPSVLLHLGMTGHVRARGDSAIRYEAGTKVVDDEWPPRFTKLRVLLEDGGEVAFTNARRLGRIRVREDAEAEPPVSELGFDPLLDMPGPKAFVANLTARRATLKGILMDQGFAAGVGNWIADEVLYQARLDPRRRGTELDEAEARRVRTVLGRIVRTACDVDADKARFPKRWLFHRRWGKDASARDADGNPIEHLTIAGRTTAWVPGVQG